MSAIDTILETIKNAVYGRDIRQAIHDGIKQCYEDATGDPLSDNTATAGQAPIADGQGGWAWGDIEAGDSVPTEVRQAILALFQNAVYISEDMADEVAVVESWASEVTAITLSKTSLSFGSVQAVILTATTTPSGATVIWSSSDTSVVTVNNGVVTPVGNGNCTITASAGSVSATCAVRVTAFATVTGISAVYTQSGTVYDTDSLDDLKNDLVVTATYDDSSTETITNYTLSGTLTEGTSTIVVSYSEKTTTFNVVVSHLAMLYPLTSGSYTFSTTGETVTVSNGNHIKIDYGTADNTGSGSIINISNLMNNGLSSLLNDNKNAVNNLSDIMFTIPANASVVLTMENVTKTKAEITDSSSGQFIVSLRKTATSTALMTSVGYPPNMDRRLSSTETITDETNCSCVFLYMLSTKENVSVEFDLLLTVNGVRWI